MPALTQAKFLNYQNIFYRNVIASPMIIKIGVQTPLPSTGDTLQDFVGGNAPKLGYPTIWNSFPALYQNQPLEFMREDFGYTQLQEGFVYLSPLQLIPVYGGFDNVDPKTMLIILDGREYMVDYIDYKEHIYDSCLFVVIKLKDSIRG